jgi:hypothetical protein
MANAAVCVARAAASLAAVLLQHRPVLGRTINTVSGATASCGRATGTSASPPPTPSFAVTPSALSPPSPTLLVTCPPCVPCIAAAASCPF